LSIISFARVCKKGVEFAPMTSTVIAAAFRSVAEIPAIVYAMVSASPIKRLRRERTAKESVICASLKPGMEDDRDVINVVLNAFWYKVVKDATLSKPWTVMTPMNSSVPEVGADVGVQVGAAEGAPVGPAVGVALGEKVGLSVGAAVGTEVG
jgi:hypothetical protein